MVSDEWKPRELKDKMWRAHAIDKHERLSQQNNKAVYWDDTRDARVI